MDKPGRWLHRGTGYLIAIVVSAIVWALVIEGLILFSRMLEIYRAL